MVDLKPRQIHHYGWRRDSLDARDFLATPDLTKATFASNASLRSKMPPVYDQGQLGSCTGNAWAAVVEYQEHVQGESTGTPSRLFIYYFERALEGTADQDAGAEIRDGAKVVSGYGAPNETEWPYSDANPGRFSQKPSSQVISDAKRHEALKYYRNRQDAWDLKWCIANGYPVVFGFTVYDSFEQGNWAYEAPFVMPMPQPNEGILGGHAIVIVGYDDAKGVLVRNSWGQDWGDGGYFYMPWAFITNPNYCSDFWTLRKES